MSQLQSGDTQVTNGIVVNDSRRVIILFIASIFSGLFAFAGLTLNEPAAALVLTPVTLVVVGLLIVHKKGYVVDVEKGVLEFPGGGYEANDVTGVFNLKKYFQRKSVPLDEIHQISLDWFSNSQLRNSIFGDLPPLFQFLAVAVFYPRHHLIVNGSFGTLRLRFFSESKRDLLYSTIAQVNEMGSPIVER